MDLQPAAQAEAGAAGADTAAVEGLSLAAAFERAAQLLGGDPSAPSAPAGGAAGARGALELLEHCERLTGAAGLFSRNEDAEDLQTPHVRYLLVPFMRAELLLAAPPPPPGSAGAAALRLRQLSAAGEAYGELLQRARQYGALGGERGDDGGPAGAADPGTERAHKIERFKRGRALAGLMQQLRGRRRAADEEAGTEVGACGGAGGWDEEDERKLWMLQVEAAALKALDALPLLRQEQQLLRHAASGEQQRQEQREQRPSEASRDARQRQQEQAAREQLQGQMMERLAGIAGQLSLAGGGDRQAIRQQVLRPSHILPTLTVEQQGAIELAAAREREAAAAEAAARAAARQAGARSDEEDEEELQRSRAWDDWKDDNPRGCGNSKLRPCA